MATRPTIGFEAIELVDITADTDESTPLSARIKAEHSKVDNRALRLANAPKGEASVDKAIIAKALEALRLDIAHKACAPDSPQAKALWDDEVKKRQDWRAENPQAQVTRNTPGTDKPYYVYLAQGSESAARMWSMTRLVNAGASLDEVYFIHEALIAQYREQVVAYNSLLALLKG